MEKLNDKKSEVIQRRSSAESVKSGKGTTGILPPPYQLYAANTEESEISDTSQIPTTQLISSGAAENPDDSNSSSNNGSGLPSNLQAGLESMSGFNMDDVSVHRNSNKPAQLQAHAYAQGSDIHLGPGQEEHLPHEAWHVVQQKQGRVKPTMQMKGKINVNDNTGLEKEADVMGAKAAQNNTKLNKPKENTESNAGPSAPLQKQKVIQRKIRWDLDGAKARNSYTPIRNPAITSSIYINQYEKVDALPDDIVIKETTDKNQGEGDYSNLGKGLNSQILLHPLEGDADAGNQHFNDNLATLTHEFQHALDDLDENRLDAFNLKEKSETRWNIIHTEWRAWAMQAAQNYELTNGENIDEAKINDHQKKMLKTYINPETRFDENNHFFRKTKKYINDTVLKGKDDLIDSQIVDWMNTIGAIWWTESISIFNEKSNILPIPDGVIVIESKEDFDTKGAALKSGGNRIERVRKEGDYRVYKLDGKEYKLSAAAIAEGHCDEVTGSWAPNVEIQDELIQIDNTTEMDIKGSELKTGRRNIEKVRREDGYKIYSLNGQEYRIKNSLLDLGYFDEATGDWA